MSVIAILRDVATNASIVRMLSTDTVAQCQVTGYLTAQADNINALNNGTWQWYSSDLVLLAASDSTQLFNVSADFSSLTPQNSVTSAALTRTNDTNVTVTLGGSPSNALLQAVSLTLGWSGQLGITRGGTGVSSVTTSPTASAWAGWDANKNLSANNFLASYATTATAAGTTILTAASANQQFFTGVTTQTVQLPVTSTLVLGESFYIVNNSSGDVTIASSGGNTILVMLASTTCLVTCISTSGTTAASWAFDYNYQSAIPLPLALNKGGSNANLTASAGSVSFSTSTALALTAAGLSGQLFQSAGAGTPVWTTATYPSTAGTLGNVLTSDGTNFVSSAPASSGTVTSVGTGLGLTGGAITTTGTVAVTGTLADVVNNVIGPNKNLIIGGNFSLNPWQRGTTFTSTANGAYTADRFYWNLIGAGVIDTLKTADAPTVAEAGIFSSNCLNIDVTTADASIAAADIYAVGYAMEGYDFAQIAQRAFTLSFWVKSTVTGIYSVAFRNSGADRTYVAEYTVNTTNTWEKKTITVSASPSAGTWNYTTGIGINIIFAIAVGSNYTTSSVSSWQSSAFYGSTNQVNGMDSASNNFKLALIQVEAGSNATGFQVRSEAEELALCQRYYEKTFNVSVAPATGVDNYGVIIYSVATAGISNRRETWTFSTKKRASPTITYYNIVSANGLWYNDSIGADSGTPNTTYIGDRSIAANNPQVIGDLIGNYCAINATADAEL